MNEYEDLKSEKLARQKEYYKRMDEIQKGIRKSNPELRKVTCESPRTSTIKLIHPNFKSRLNYIEQ